MQLKSPAQKREDLSWLKDRRPPASSISGVLLILYEKDWKKKKSHGRHPSLEATFKPCFVFPG